MATESAPTPDETRTISPLASDVPETKSDTVEAPADDSVDTVDLDEDIADIPARQLRDKLSVAHRENARYRERIRTAEAEKTELNKRLGELENVQLDNHRMIAASKFGLDFEDLDLLGSGTPDEIEKRAKRLAELQDKAASSRRAPTRKPIDHLTGGGDPTTPPAKTDILARGEEIARQMAGL